MQKQDHPHAWPRLHWTPPAYGIHFARHLPKECKLLLMAAWKQPEVVVEFLLFQGASPHCQDGFDRTPLHLAATFHQPGNIKQLLHYGARIDVKDQWGKTPLQRAQEGGRARSKRVDLCRRLFDEAQS